MLSLVLKSNKTHDCRLYLNLHYFTLALDNQVIAFNIFINETPKIKEFYNIKYQMKRERAIFHGPLRGLMKFKTLMQKVIFKDLKVTDI